MVVKKLLGLLYLVVACFKHIFSCIWRRQTSHIGELPFVIPKSERESVSLPSYDGCHSANSQWSSWDDQSFGVQSKIEEYRRQKETESANLKAKGTSSSQSKIDSSSDYFGQMQPQFKATKTLLLNSSANQQHTNRNLFEVREGGAPVGPETTELGDLDLDSVNSPASQYGWGGSADGADWDEQEDLSMVVDQVEREQKRREREEKHRQRLMEHERRLNRKRNEKAHAPASRSAF